jgi:hypothetical protein
MKLHHAAALALVGWYLMIPPTEKDLDDSCGAHSPSGLTLAPVSTLPETATTMALLRKSAKRWPKP